MKKNLLIVHAGAMGDFILTWPALIRLKRAGYHLTAILPKRSLRLGLRFGLIDEGKDMELREVMPFFSGDSLPEGLEHNGAILWLHRDERLANLIGKSVSLPPLFINPKPDGPVHVARYHVDAVRTVFPVEDSGNMLIGFPDARPVGGTVLIHPGSGGVDKRFPPEVYREIGAGVRRLGFQTAFLLGPVELDSCLSEDFQGESVIESGNIDSLAELLSKTGLFIGNDSGPSHLSGFMGVPTLVLYRTTNPAVWGAIGRKVCHLGGGNGSAMVESVFMTVQEWMMERNKDAVHHQ